MRFVVPSICITEANMTRAHPAQYMANVAMKANLKVTGINHSTPGIEELLNNTFVLGADCTHLGSGALVGNPSVAAVVGSLTKNGGRSCGRFQLQAPKLEVCISLLLSND